MRSIRRRWALGFALGVVAASAVPASAARVKLDAFQFHGTFYTVGYTADPGEANDVTTQTSPSEVTIDDPGAVILPVTLVDQPDPLPDLPDGTTLVRCVSLVTSVTCNVIADRLTGQTAGFVGLSTVSLGDRDDRAVVSGGTVDGGPGNDELSSLLSTTMIGGLGADRINGGPGGQDSAAYARQYPGLTGDGITVTLDGIANDGLAGEGDNVSTEVERVSGTDGNDSITLSDADNGHTPALGGDDLVVGLGGNDWLLGDDGADFLDGGPGDDSLNPNIGFDNPDGDVDTIDCGPGDDRVSAPEPHDVLIDCEEVVP